MDQNTSNHAGVVLAKGRNPMEVLLRQRNEYASLLKSGDIVEGTVLEKRGSRLYVDLGVHGTGLAFGREYYDAHDAIKGLAPGDRVTAKVVDPDNEEGYVELSLREAGREKNWQELKRLMETGEAIRARVTDANRGGLILAHLGVQGFLPASQLSAAHYPRVEGGDKEKIFEALKKIVGQELEVSIIDMNPADGKLIFSEKFRETEAVRQRLAAYHAGGVIEGEVAGIVSFGAFVKFGEGLEGLVHISEIDWQLISNPADILKAGQVVKAKIIGIEGDKVSLSLKALKEDPWSKVAERYKQDEVVTGVVVKFNPFGAFVKLDGEIQGLAHLSEFGTEAKMKEALKLNEPHRFRVLSVDPAAHRLALGLVRDESVPQPEAVSVEPIAAESVASTEPPAGAAADGQAS